jgi:hypothetical protein
LYPPFAMLQLMMFREMPLEAISCEDETFRISEELDCVSIQDSLRRIGQLNPVVLLDQKQRMLLVCGFRRVRALQRVDVPRVFARILPMEEWNAARAFEYALWDNLSHRQLNPLEKARALHKLSRMCGVDEASLVGTYLPALGLSPNSSVLASYLSLNAMHEDLRRCLLEGRLTLSSLESLVEQPAQIQEYLASLMNRIRLSASLQKKVLGLLGELASMQGASFDAPLREPQMLAMLEDAGLSPFQKGEKVHEILYRLVNPRLSRATDRFQAQKKLLDLPGSIQINAHPFFEEPGVHVEFNAPDPERFRRLAASLYEASQSPELDPLFQVD